MTRQPIAESRVSGGHGTYSVSHARISRCRRWRRGREDIHDVTWYGDVPAPKTWLRITDVGADTVQIWSTNFDLLGEARVQLNPERSGSCAVDVCRDRRESGCCIAVPATSSVRLRRTRRRGASETFTQGRSCGHLSQDVRPSGHQTRLRKKVRRSCSPDQHQGRAWIFVLPQQLANSCRSPTQLFRERYHGDASLLCELVGRVQHRRNLTFVLADSAPLLR